MKISIKNFCRPCKFRETIPLNSPLLIGRLYSLLVLSFMGCSYLVFTNSLQGETYVISKPVSFNSYQSFIILKLRKICTVDTYDTAGGAAGLHCPLPGVPAPGPRGLCPRVLQVDTHQIREKKRPHLRVEVYIAV